MASEPRGRDDRVTAEGPDHGVAVSAEALATPGEGPTPLARAFTLGPPLPEMAGHPELGHAHQGWVDLEARAPDGGGADRRVAGLVVRILRRHPEYRQQRELLAQLTRVVDALAKRCDELERRLRLLHDETVEVADVLSEDLTRLSALAAVRRDASPPDA